MVFSWDLVDCLFWICYVMFVLDVWLAGFVYVCWCLYVFTWCLLIWFTRLTFGLDCIVWFGREWECFDYRLILLGVIILVVFGLLWLRVFGYWLLLFVWVLVGFGLAFLGVNFTVGLRVFGTLCWHVWAGLFGG